MLLRFQKAYRLTVPVINTEAGSTPASNTPKKQRATARVAKLLVKDIKQTTIPQHKPIELSHQRGLILCKAKLHGISATTYYICPSGLHIDRNEKW
jgi:hypothetical protein